MASDGGRAIPFSNFIVYVDESGDHSLTQVTEAYPVFVLAFCIFEKARYVADAVPAMQSLKFRWFGHDAVVFHEREIRKQLVPFKFLQSLAVRNRFMADLDAAIDGMRFTIIASVIDKQRLRKKYAEPAHPYEIALQFCLERLYRHLSELDQTGGTTHCVFEKRGAAEDTSLELAFRRICAGENFAGTKMTCFDI
jgi:hypothetical protein